MSESATPLSVLYVDDDPMALTLTQLQLLRQGIHTETTSDALEAVGILTTQKLDLILLDSVMPTIDGVEFLQLIRSLNLKHPVVFFTGHGTEELRAMTREFDVLDLLDKQADNSSCRSGCASSTPSTWREVNPLVRLTRSRSILSLRRISSISRLSASIFFCRSAMMEAAPFR